MVKDEAPLTISPAISSITLTQRSNFAVQHLMAAARFSRMCGEIENRNKGLPLGSFFDEQIAYVSATVFLATASLESYINEVWADSEDGVPEIGKNTRIKMEKEYEPILDKFQRTLRENGFAPFPEREQPYEDTNALIKFRNALVHFKPEWHHRQMKHKIIENLLKGKFEINPFIDEFGVFFPQGCMSYGCTKWVIFTVLRFVNAFCARACLENKFDMFIERIDPIYRPDT